LGEKEINPRFWREIERCREVEKAKHNTNFIFIIFSKLAITFISSNQNKPSTTTTIHVSLITTTEPATIPPSMNIMHTNTSTPHAQL